MLWTKVASALEGFIRCCISHRHWRPLSVVVEVNPDAAARAGDGVIERVTHRLYAQRPQLPETVKLDSTAPDRWNNCPHLQENRQQKLSNQHVKGKRSRI